MLCQRCSQHPAAIHFQRNVNGKHLQIHLCQDCYKDLGGASSSDIGWPTLLGGIDGLQSAMGRSEINRKPKCDNCGLTYDQFISNGKFGCANCYGEFNEKLELMFKRLHGSAVHQGRLPGEIKKKRLTKAERLADLRQKLAIAVKEEDYKKAAVLRDKIIAMEKKGAEGNDE